MASRRKAAISFWWIMTGCFLLPLMVPEHALGHSAPGSGRTPCRCWAQRRSSLFPGPSSDPANLHIRDLRFPPAAAEDFAADPDLGGLLVSIRELLVVFRDETTVGQANQLLEEVGAGIDGGIPELKLVLLCFPSFQTLSDLKRAWDRLRNDPLVAAAAPNTEIDFDVTTDPSKAAADWTWGIPPKEKNWNLEVARAPQAWNLSDWIVKRGGKARLGIIDTAFDEKHEDLKHLTVFIGPSGTKNHLGRQPLGSHGTKVAGVAAAAWQNGLGIDGAIGDRAPQVVGMPAALLPKANNVDAADWGRSMLDDLTNFSKNHKEVRVVNASLGYAWSHRSIDQDTDLKVQKLVTDQAKIYAAGKRDYVVVASAGNDTGKQAKWNSPMCHAALVLGAGDSLCVEAAGIAGGGGYELTTLSNVDGSLASPVEGAVTTKPRNSYETMSGATSFAPPLVAGAASFLVGYRPVLKDKMPDLLSALTKSTRSLPNSKGMLDLFAAILRLDLIAGKKEVQQDLVDIDDGTLDGNRRLIPFTDPARFDDAIHTTNNAGASKHRGDGFVNMRDFRAFRDAFLQHCLQNPGGGGQEPSCVPAADILLDGDATHPKRDINGDGCFNQTLPRGSTATDCSKAPLERVYPRSDFNGDGFGNYRKAAADDPATQVRDKTDLDLLADSDFWKTLDSTDGGQTLDNATYSDRVALAGDDANDDPPAAACPTRYHAVTRNNLLTPRNLDAKPGGNPAPAWITGLPDYLHSGDVTLRFKWADVPGHCDAVTLRIQSEYLGNNVDDNGVDGVDEAFEKSFLKIIQAARGSREQVMVTVPLYTRNVRVSWSFVDCDDPPTACPQGNLSFSLKFGEDKPVSLP